MPATTGSAVDYFENTKTGGPQNAGRGDELCGDLNVIKTTVTLVGDESASDVVTLTPPLRQGQIIVPALSYVAVPSAAGTTLTVKVGTATDDDNVATGLDVSTAGARSLGALDTTIDTFAAGDQIIMTFTTATSPTAARTITFYFVTRSV